MRRSLGLLIILAASVLIGLSVYNSGAGALSQGGTCAAGTTRFVIARHCAQDTVYWAICIPLSVGLLVLGLWLHGLKNDLRGAVLVQGFFLALGLGILMAGLESDDAFTRWFGLGMCLVMIATGSPNLIIQLSRKRRGIAKSRR